MAVPEPSDAFGLWAAVKPRIGGWIETDEDQVAELGRQWTAAGQTFRDVLSGGGPAGEVPPTTAVDQLLHPGGSWGDEAGEIWQRQMLNIGRGLQDRAAEMDTVARHVQAFADDVAYAKEAIVDAIEANAEVYGQLALTPDGAAEAAQSRFAAGLAGDINEFLDAMAGQVAGRRPGVEPTGDRPALQADPASYDEFGDVDEWADKAGVVSSATGVAALAAAPIPIVGEVAVPILGGISLLTGLFALGVHGVKAIEDPSFGNVVTAGGDAVALVPGVGALARGGVKGLAEMGQPAQLWTDLAGGAPGGAALQSGSLLAPQAPVVADLLDPHQPDHLAEQKDANAWQFLLWRMVDAASMAR